MKEKYCNQCGRFGWMVGNICLTCESENFHNYKLFESMQILKPQPKTLTSLEIVSKIDNMNLTSCKN
jgi:hypothetical protein